MFSLNYSLICLKFLVCKNFKNFLPHVNEYNVNDVYDEFVVYLIKDIET
jgi:hypothetical protein